MTNSNENGLKVDSIINELSIINISDASSSQLSTVDDAIQLIKQQQAELEAARKEIDRIYGLLCPTCGGQGEVCHVAQDGSYDCEVCPDCEPKMYIREGWQLVPIEPTSQMIESMIEGKTYISELARNAGRMYMKMNYKAALRVAPKPEENDCE